MKRALITAGVVTFAVAYGGYAVSTSGQPTTISPETRAQMTDLDTTTRIAMSIAWDGLSASDRASICADYASDPGLTTALFLGQAGGAGYTSSDFAAFVEVACKAVNQ